MLFNKYTSSCKSEGIYRIPEYEKTRHLLHLECMSAQGITSLVTGQFIAGYLAFLGINETTSAILMQIQLVASIAYIIAPLVYERTRRRLHYLGIFLVIYRMALVALCLVPLFARTVSSRIMMLGVIIIAAYFFSYLGDGGWVDFMSGCVPARQRGGFLPQRDANMVLAGTVVSLALGYVLDIFRDHKAENIGFFIIFFFVFVFAAINGWALKSMTQPPIHINREKIGLKAVLTLPMKDRLYRKYIIFHILYNFSVYIGLSLFSIYPVVTLGMSYSYMAFLGLLATVSRMVSAKLWQRLKLKMSWPVIMIIAHITLAVSFIIWAFVIKENAYVLLPLANIVSGAGWGGIAVSLFANNVIFAPKQSRTVYFSFNACVGALTGFLSSLLGAVVSGSFKNITISILGLDFCNMQIMFFISAVLLLLTAVYIFFVMNKETESIT
ncbi:MAG: hypothetical protein Q8865_05205 [Bacillota bacterium]|nr:hypothetical protein [Bacillota bacterium]